MDEEFDFAKIVEEKRKEKKWTKTQLASETGLSVSYISMLESGQKKPAYKTIKKIGTALEIPNRDLLNIFRFDDSPAQDAIELDNGSTRIREFNVTGLSESDIKDVIKYIELLRIKNAYHYLNGSNKKD
ncbi:MULTISPECIES: helix-turn-helix domain-containing protein [Bacillus]|uniref:helix-turn-helix domain-containing protein n=1 Tax=Bacillus TaxID=1386 RepID=UPI000D031202|nr:MULTISPECIES: helix-turn-helix transcriptional regulator [Bacillus]MCM3140304.1 helix-turn-helix transcriptional regulator [Bacillus safensis]PRS35734.1 hypothetical protein C6Y02_17125 [Bacillus sp. NMCC4]UUD44640.1 helix-turn-helix transcriptional regulator [Bacillus pumilus]